MFLKWKDRLTTNYGHLRPATRMMFPVGGGLLGLLVSFGWWYALTLAATLIATTDPNLLRSLQAPEAAQPFTELAQIYGIERHIETLSSFSGIGPLYIAAVGVAMIFGSVMVIFMLCGQWMFMSSGSAFAAIWRAVNGHAPSTRADIRTILGAGSLLALWLAVFGKAVWIFIVWDTVLIGGIGAALWRLRHPAERERFNVEARAELRQAAQAGGTLGLVCLFILAILLGNAHAGIEGLKAPWPTMLAIGAAGIVLLFYLRVEQYLLNAWAIAKREHEIYKKARSARERGE